MEIIDRLNLLQQQSGMKPKDLTIALGINQSAFTDWKKGKSKPGLTPLIKFSKYFGVSLDWLVFGNEDSSSNESISSTSDYAYLAEKKMIQKFRLLPTNCKQNVLSYMDGMLAALPNETLSVSDNDLESKKLSV